jgi:hypothetical protein
MDDVYAGEGPLATAATPLNQTRKLTTRFMVTPRAPQQYTNSKAKFSSPKLASWTSQFYPLQSENVTKYRHLLSWKEK